jgi:glycoprotein endo-alpha-1,2-mannosidase
MIPAALFCTVHIAYYLWYGNPEHDGKWMHWDHKLLPHWNAATEAETARLHRLKYGWADEQSAWLPPVNQHSPFRPLRGLYSSSDDEVLRSHMLEMASVGVDTAMFSWWGRSDVKKRDDSGSGANTDLLLGAAMRHAKQASIEISIHVEPYGGRTPESFFEDAVYIGESYLARTDMRPASNRFTFWLYDVSIDHTAPNERTRWHDVLARVRTLYSSAHRIEVSFFCLWLHQHDAEFGRAVGFDGGYAVGFAFGAKPNRPRLSRMRAMLSTVSL